MHSILLFAAFSLLIMPLGFSQVAPVSSIEDLFAKDLAPIATHQLLFLSRPSNQKLKTQKKLLADAPQSCLIITKDLKQYKTTCRYFILEDQIEILTPENRRILQSNQVMAVKIADKIFVPKSYHFNGDLFYGYFQLLVEGKYSLYKKYNSSIKKDGNPEKELDETYYYQKGKQEILLKFEKIKKKNIAICFKTELARWNSYCNKQKPKFKKESDLIELFQHFNRSDVED